MNKNCTKFERYQNSSLYLGMVGAFKVATIHIGPERSKAIQKSACDPKFLPDHFHTIQRAR